MSDDIDISHGKSKDSQCNDQEKKDKSASHDLENTTHKTDKNVDIKFSAHYAYLQYGQNRKIGTPNQ